MRQQNREGVLPAGAADGLAKGGAVEVFAQVHESEEGVEDAGFHFIGQVQAAGRSARQHFSLLGDVPDDFRLARVMRSSINGFAAHLRAFAFQFQGEMQDAEPHWFEGRRYRAFATVFAARRVCRHR